MKTISVAKRIAASIVIFLGFAVAPQTICGDTLNFYIQPYLPATELVKRFNPLAKYVSDRMGASVRVKISKNYDSHIDAAGKNKGDIFYFGPGPYIKMVEKYGQKPLLARLEVRNSPVYYGMIVVRRDSPLQLLSELKGKSFAFGDPHSTMSYYVPRYMLREAGVQTEDLGHHEFLGTHHDVALAVIGGYYDAGAIKEEVFYRYEERGLRALAQSRPISEHVFVANSNMDTMKLKRLLRFKL